MDSSEKIVRCFHAAARDNGLADADPTGIRNTIGLSLSEGFARLYPNTLQYQINKLVADYREHWLFHDKTPMKLFPGVRQGFASLQESGYLIAVATGKSRRGLDRAMQEDDLSGVFVTSRCADESRSKPHPQMLHEILDYTGLQSTEALMIGDTTFDLEMAKSADMPGWGVSYGAHRAEDLQPLSAYAVANNFADLVSYLCKAEPNSKLKTDGSKMIEFGSLPS